MQKFVILLEIAVKFTYKSVTWFETQMEIINPNQNSIIDSKNESALKPISSVITAI